MERYSGWSIGDVNRPAGGKSFASRIQTSSLGLLRLNQDYKITQINYKIH